MNHEAMRKVQSRLDRLTKPPGSLGRLETLAVQLAGITGQPFPHFSRRAVYVLAADHGVVEEGVSAYPQAVTAQMVLNFLRGGAAINVLARHAGAQVVVADFGVKSDLPPEVLNCKVDSGTRNMVRGPAMTREQAEHAIRLGRSLVRDVDLVCTGEMGIGNTTASSAMTAVLTGKPVAEVTGRGTGLADVAHKVSVIERAIERTRPNPKDPIDVLSKVGGFEIAGLVGVILEAAERRLPVVLDGFISGTAALVASRVAPIRECLIAAHRSTEPGHRAVLADLGLAPLLELDLRLGEGTGAVLALPILDAACKILREMATFDEAGVSER